MSTHTKEAQHLKKHAIDKILTQMYGYMEDEKAGKKISSSHKPKMYLRMARLLAGTDDSVFIDTVDNLLSKNATGDEIKNALRGISERVIPKARKRVFSDRLHHGIPLELMDVLMKQEPEVMLDFLQAAEDDGRFFGDSAPNIDNSFQEQSHTAAKDKASSKIVNHPHQLGIRGMREFSAHPEGTNKGYDKSLDKIYAKGTEMYEAFKPAIAEAEYSLKLGINADKSRRVVANRVLVERGLLKPGEDYWSTEMSSERIEKIRKVLADPELGLTIAASQNPMQFQDAEDLAKHGKGTPDIMDWSRDNIRRLQKVLLAQGFNLDELQYLAKNDGVLSFNAGFGPEGARFLSKFVKDNLGGEATGALYGLLMDPDLQKAVDSGNGREVTNILARDALIGGLTQQGVNTLGRLAPSLAKPVAGALTAANTAMPIAAVSQIKGSTDPFVTQQRDIKALESGDESAMQTAQLMPSRFGKQGPDITSKGEVITPQKPLIDATPLYNKLSGIATDTSRGILRYFKPKEVTEEELDFAI